MSDPTYDFLASGGGGASASASSDPTHDFLVSGGANIPDTPSTAGGYPLKTAAGGLVLRELSGLGANILAGGRAAYDMTLGGKTVAQADTRAKQFVQEHTFQPEDPTTKGLVSAFESNANPLNWFAKGADIVGESINRATDPRTWTGTPPGAGSNPLLADKAGTPIAPPVTTLPTTGTGSTAAGPIISGALQLGAGAAGLRGGTRPLPRGASVSGWPAKAAPAAATPSAEVPGAAPAPPELTASGAPRAAPFEPQDIPGKPGVAIDTEPVEGGLPDAVSNQRAAILQRVGIDQARESALQGDAKRAATDFQLSRFDEPTGVEAKAQFDAERQALQAHAEKIVQRTGGTLGTDEDSLNGRGQTIAAPFDALSDWFDAQRKKLYAAADQRSGGHPVVQPLSLKALLNDNSFKNQLTARDQMHVLTGVQAELERFKETNPQGLTVQNAEQFRQFLNTLWSPETSSIIGKMKGALDDDVMKGAGEDLYRPARALSQLQKQTLENPDGVLKLIERDPQTPINRTTAFNKIPDTLTRLSPAQFDNVLKTLKTMPQELQPQAQAAIAEIRAHLANKVYDAGNSTSGQWNARGVEKVIKANSAKLQSAFADQSEVLHAIADLRSAGNILAVNQSYPGAAAQAANALKRGMMSRTLGKMGATAGGTVGAGLGSVLGPFGAAGGAAAGAAAGETLGSAAGQSMAEKAALKNWKRGVRKLSPTP